MQMATLGAKRLLNTNDQYQGAIFNLLQKIDRDFTLRPEGVADTEAWNVVGKQLPVLPFGMQ